MEDKKKFELEDREYHITIKPSNESPEWCMTMEVRSGDLRLVRQLWKPNCNDRGFVARLVGLYFTRAVNYFRAGKSSFTILDDTGVPGGNTMLEPPDQQQQPEAGPGKALPDPKNPH